MEKIAFCRPYERGQIICRFSCFPPISNWTEQCHIHTTWLLSAVSKKWLLKSNFRLLLWWISSEDIAGTLKAYTSICGKSQMNVYLLQVATKMYSKLFCSDLLLITAILNFCLQNVNRDAEIEKETVAHLHQQEHTIWVK